MIEKINALSEGDKCVGVALLICSQSNYWFGLGFFFVLFCFFVLFWVY